MIPTTPRFDRYFKEFYLPHETVFKRGHFNDYNYAISENETGDSGGLTKFGIDQRSHPSIDIEKLTLADAESITYLEDWLAVHAEIMPPGYGEALCDIKVNGGNGAKMLQCGLNEILPVNEQLTVDGIIGIRTLNAARTEGKAGLLALLAYREAYYREIAKQPSKTRFLAGWLNRNNDLKTFALECWHKGESSV